MPCYACSRAYARARGRGGAAVGLRVGHHAEDLWVRFTLVRRSYLV